MRSLFLLTRSVFAFSIFASILSAQDAQPGRVAFESSCARCHGADGNGGEMGPAIPERLAAKDDQQLITLIHDGLPTRGMPPSSIKDPELTSLVRFLRRLQARPAKVRRSVQTVKGTTLEGVVLGEGFEDLQLLTDDKRVHLLRKSGDRFREVTSETNWPSYNGDPRGNRYTELNQITKANVKQLAAKWVFSVPNAGRLQVTPVVVDGIMYITAANECFALDAGNGRQIWRHQVRPTRGMTHDPGVNRGVGVAGDRVFMETGNAHLIALNRFTGELLWDSEIADWHQSYFATSAPLTAGDLVITGLGGGEHGANGYVVAFNQATGKEAWRFATVPPKGEPGSETWQGPTNEHGGAPTWFTGSYDPELDTVYWPTGNPAQEYNGDSRPGDNLYSDCILALDRKTGKLKWHYQFTPHDLWDWDATETSVMVNADWEGRPRKLMLHANRNGFFYVFDRVDGKLLLWSQFATNLNWASGIDAQGRPVKLPGLEPTKAGTKVCPSQDGATNWYSPSYMPATGMYYFQTMEKCSIYQKSEQGPWEPGKTYLGGSQRTGPDPKPRKVLKALNIRTGKIVWELDQPGPSESWGGTLATVTGLVIFGAEDGSLRAIDATNSKTLWSFPTNNLWKASPMTYAFDGKQYIGVASGANIFAFGVN
jgi:alcohol dehydrogenase (cytochrome c)